MAAITRYSLVYGSADKVRFPLGKDREDLFKQRIEGILDIEPEANVVDSVKRYIGFIEENSPKSALFIPKFIGILQSKVIESPIETSALIKESEDLRSNQSLFSEAGGLALKIASIDEGPIFEPNIIHLAFDPSSGINRGNLTQSFGGALPKRIAVSPIDKLPQFYKKDPNAVNSLVELVSDLVMAGNSSRDIQRLIAPDVMQIQGEMQVYGATSIEYGLLAPVLKMYSVRPIK